MRTRVLVFTAVLGVIALGTWWLFDSPEQVTAGSSGSPAQSAPGQEKETRASRVAGTERTEPGLDDDAPRPAPRAALHLDAGAAPDASLQAIGELMEAEAIRAWLRLNAAAAEKYVDRYCAEMKRLGTIKALGDAPKTRSRDAALFMAGRSDWEDDHVGMLHLPASLTQRMGNPPMNWRNFTEADYAGLDFGWMRELLQFDHWNMSTAGPLKDGLTTSFLEAPLPNFLTLQHWVKLRLVKGRREGDLAQASLEVRHVADLCGSTGTLIGEMIRASMYGIERGFIEDQGLQSPQPLLSAEDVQRVRQSAWAGTYMLFPGVPRSVREKALGCNPLLRCSTLGEAIGVTASMRNVYERADEDLEWLIAQGPCDPALAELARKSPGAPVSMLFDSYTGEPGVEKWMRIMLDGGL